MKDKQLMEFTEEDKLDLSQRLAEELNLDTSNMSTHFFLYVLLIIVREVRYVRESFWK